MKSILLIGLGRFGKHVAMHLLRCMTWHILSLYIIPLHIQFLFL